MHSASRNGFTTVLAAVVLIADGQEGGVYELSGDTLGWEAVCRPVTPDEHRAAPGWTTAQRVTPGDRKGRDRRLGFSRPRGAREPRGPAPG